MKDASDIDLTRMLGEAAEGSITARDQVVEAVYHQLHRLASRVISGERPGGTLQTTALVNEAFMRLFGESVLKVNDRHHFLNIAAMQMRRILIDRARAHKTDKRKGVHVSLEDAGQISLDRSAELIALDDALKVLAEVDPAAADVVEKKYFGGYTDEETAKILGINVAKVRRDWTFARAWLHDYLDRT